MENLPLKSPLKQMDDHLTNDDPAFAETHKNKIIIRKIKRLGKWRGAVEQMLNEEEYQAKSHLIL